MSKHKRLRRLAAISRDESVTAKELAELIRERIQYAEDLADTRLRKLRELEERFTEREFSYFVLAQNPNQDARDTV